LGRARNHCSFSGLEGYALTVLTDRITSWVVGHPNVEPSFGTHPNGFSHESLDVTLAHLKGKDADSEEAQEHANSSSLALYA